MTTYPTEVRPTLFGIVLALYPSDVRNHIEIQRAPDSGGSPDTGNAETIGLAAPGQRTYTDLRGAGTWHYRIRHVRPGATASDWIGWAAATAKPIPRELPNVPEVGGWIIKQGRLESTDGNIKLDAPGETITIGAATDPTTGTGIFAGSDGAGGYDFRAGNPSGQHMHFDESAGELIFTGTLKGNTFEIRDAAGSVVGEIRTLSNILIVTADTGDAVFRSEQGDAYLTANNGDVVLAPDGGSRVVFANASTRATAGSLAEYLEVVVDGTFRRIPLHSQT